MIKLLNANFYRLKKNKIFWLINFISFGLALFNVFHYQSLRGIATLDRIITEYMTLYLGIFVAFFVSIFTGIEYSDGTIRNKVISGHKRTHIYLANLIVGIVVGLIAEFIYIFTVFVIGKDSYGELQMMSLPKIILYTILVVIAFCSIYNLISILCANMSMSIVMCIIICVFMFVANGIVSSKVRTSKYVYDYTNLSETSDIIELNQKEKILNPNYPSENTMRIYKLIYFLMPTGQADAVNTVCSESSKYGDEDIKNIYKENLDEMPVYSVALIMVSNIVGIYLFKRQEIK